MVWSRTRSVLLFIGALIILNSCVNQLTMHARDGEKLDGKWRFAREGSGLIEVEGSAGELLVGTFSPVPRHIFFADYQKPLAAEQSTPMGRTSLHLATPSPVSWEIRML